MKEYPCIEKSEFGYDVSGLEVPPEYFELVKKITHKNKEGFEETAKLIYNQFLGDRRPNYYPELTWQKRGLTSIVIGANCTGAYLGDKNYSYHNVETSIEAITLFKIITSYLNALQTLK